MREIKFKAKTINDGNWVESMTISKGKIKRKSENYFIELNEDEWVGVISESVKQYLNINDKNGNEIYDGDKVKFHMFTQELGSNLGVIEGEREIIGEIYYQELGLWFQSDKEDDCGYLAWFNGIHEESFELIEE